MRQKRMSLPTLLLAAVLSVLIGFSGVMCLHDAFSLSERPAVLLAVCAAAAVLTAAASLLRRRRAVTLLLLAACAAVVLWQRQAVMDSVFYVLRRITEEYVLAFPNMQVLGQENGDGFWVLAAVGVLLTWSTAWVITREGSVVLVILAALPILLLCLMVVELAPVLWLILLTGGLLVLLISQNVRERSAAEGSRLAWWLVLPTVILICAITTLWPPADYVRADWSDTLQELAERRTGVQTWRETTFTVRPRWNRELKTVDLSRVGPKILTGTPVLEYRTEEEISYLRGLSLAVYDGNRWQAADSSNFGDLSSGGFLQTSPVEQQKNLQVRTRFVDPRMYTTYDLAKIPEQGSSVDDAYIRNSGDLLEYTVQFGSRRTDAVGLSAAQVQVIKELYTQIPEELQAPLRQILEENGLTGGSAEAIAGFVRNLGRYDLNTPAVPAGRDFVLYFLQESRQGYCIHFATSTVMLLRAAGIPSRYVTGYAVSGAANQWNTVTEDEAHAWVEYYTYDKGWQTLEPTPAAAFLPPEQEQEPDLPDRTPLPDDGENLPEEPEQTEPSVPGEPPVSVQTGSKRTLLPLLWLLLLPGVLALIVLRRWVGLRYRMERCRKGHPNRCAMAWWRWLVQLHRAAGQTMPEELLCLAEKARFSQHTMTDEELALFRQAVEDKIAALRQLPLNRRLWLQYGLGLF